MLSQLKRTLSFTKERPFKNELMVEGFIPNAAFEEGDKRVEMGHEHWKLAHLARSMLGMHVEGAKKRDTIIDVHFDPTDRDHRRVAAYLRVIRDAGDMRHVTPTVHVNINGLAPDTEIIHAPDYVRVAVLRNLVGKDMVIRYRQNEAKGEFRL